LSVSPPSAFLTFSRQMPGKCKNPLPIQLSFVLWHLILWVLNMEFDLCQLAFLMPRILRCLLVY
jgi:hypothetical protein